MTGWRISKEIVYQFLTQSRVPFMIAHTNISAMRITIFDTETTHLPIRGGKLSDQPSIIQFASQTFQFDPLTSRFFEISRYNQLIKPACPISADSLRITGITEKMVSTQPDFAQVVDQILAIFRNTDLAVAHNISFDQEVLEFEMERLGLSKNFLPINTFDSMEGTRDLCKLPGKSGYKAPRLMELHQFLLNESFPEAHNAEKDVEALARCLKVLLQNGLYKPVIQSGSDAVAEQGSLF